jgi:hypothetical protein
MAHQNGGGDAFATAESVDAGTHEAPSLDGFSGSATDEPFAEQPELLLGAAFLGGLVIGGLVSRLGR